MVLDLTFSCDLTGKTALVTGASSGLGAHFARTLARAGAKVVAAARNVNSVAELADEIGTTGGSCRTVCLDVTSIESVGHAIEASGPIDILINNAGVTNSKPVLDQTEADWEQIVDTNLTGAFRVAVGVARVMRAFGKGGSIVNIASVLGLRQAGQVTPYAVTKAGVIQMTKQMALELARHDIRVNAIAPGYFMTDLNAAFFGSEAGKALIRRVPQRRLGRLEELDGALLLFCSGASSYMTGSVLAVDGGHLTSSL